MAEDLTLEQVQSIIQSRPNIPREQIVEHLLSRGHTINGRGSMDPTVENRIGDIFGIQPTGELRPAQSFTEQFSERFVPSVKKVGEDIKTVLNNPVESGQGLAKLTRGAMGAVLPEEIAGVPIFAATDEEKKILESVISNMKSRLSDPVQTLKSDPGGALLMDLPTVLGGAGAASRALGLTTKAGALGKIGRVADVADKATDVVTTPIRITKAAISKANRALKINQKVFDAFADKLTASSTGIHAGTARNIAKRNIAGVKPERWLNDRGISGSIDKIVEKLDDISRGSKKAVDDGLAKVKGSYKSQSLDNVLGKLEKEFDDVLSEKSIATKDRIAELRQKHADTGLTLSEANEVKRLLDKEISPFTKSGDIKSSAEDLANLRDEVKVFIERKASDNGLPNIKELNKETQVSTEIKNAIEHGKTQGRRNRVVGPSDFFVGGTAWLGGLKLGSDAFESLANAVGVVLAKKVAESPAIKTAIAIKLRKLGGSRIKELQSAIASGKVAGRNKALLTRITSEAVEETRNLSRAALQQERAEAI